MAIPPLGADPDASFARFAEGTAAGYRSDIPYRLELSAGMSGDLEAAVDMDPLVCVSVPRYWDHDR